jgi:hypothetical protein
MARRQQAPPGTVDGNAGTDPTGGGTIDSGSGIATFATPGQGWFLSTGATAIQPSGSTGFLSTFPNQTAVFQIMLLGQFTISTIAFQLLSGSTAGKKFAFGIYSADGLTKLIDTGAITASGAAGNGTVYAITLGSPVTIGPGTFLFAQTAEDESMKFPGISMNNNQLLMFWPTWYDKYPAPQSGGATIPTYAGWASNYSAAGVLPSTLGTINRVENSLTITGWSYNSTTHVVTLTYSGSSVNPFQVGQIVLFSTFTSASFNNSSLTLTQSGGGTLQFNQPGTTGTTSGGKASVTQADWNWAWVLFIV